MSYKNVTLDLALKWAFLEEDLEFFMILLRSRLNHT